MLADLIKQQTRQGLADRARFVHFPLFLKEMKASNWPSANYNFLMTFGFLANGDLSLADLDGIQIRRKTALPHTDPPKLHTRGQLRLLGSKPVSLDPATSVENQIRSAFREKGIDAEGPLNELFAALDSPEEGRTLRVKPLALSAASLIGEPVHALRKNNVVPLFPNQGVEAPAPA